MRIKTLSLTELRRYRDRTFELAPGLTIVRGPNEAGKSTIQRAIELGLTRKVTSSASDLDGLLPWNGDPDARTTIAMTFTYEDEDGVSRDGSLTKSFRGAKGTVSLDLGGDPITDPARADEELAAISGVPTEGFFRSTASVRHHELAGLQRDEGALRDRLQASISGADRGTSRAKRKLERAIHDLQTRGVKNPGRLKVAEDAGHRDHRPAPGRRGRAPAPRARPRRARRRARPPRRGRDRAPRAPLDAREGPPGRAPDRRARRRPGPLRALPHRGHRPRRDRRARAHPPVAHAAARAPQLGRPHAHRRRQDRDPRRACSRRARSASTTARRRPSAGAPLSRWSLVLVLIGIAISALSFLLLFGDIVDFGVLPIILGGAVALIGLVLAVVGWWLRRATPTYEQLQDSQVNRRLRGRSEIEQELREAQAEHDDLLLRLGLTTFAEAEERLGLEEAHVAEIEQRRAHLSGLDRRREARRAAGPPRHRRARDRAEDGGARGARADRQGAAGPRAPRGRGRGRRAAARPDARRRGQRPGARGAEPGRRRGGGRDRGAPRRGPRGAGPAPPPGARLRADARGAQHRRAGDDAARDALPRAAHGRAT